MDLKRILKELENCPCGHTHTFEMEAVEIGHGVTQRAGELLLQAGFGKRLLLVADDNTIAVAKDLLPSLEGAGFDIKKLIYGSGGVAEKLDSTVADLREIKGAYL